MRVEMSSFRAAMRWITIAACSAAAVLGSAANSAAAPTGDTLMGTLPQGFSSTNCKAETPRAPALEKVNCEKSSDPAGPNGAAFGLYANLDDLASALDVITRQMAVSPTCPGNQKSPGNWLYGSSNQAAGRVACGTTSDDSSIYAIAWTDNAKLRAAVVIGPEITDLYRWWSSKSG
jgi:hypothetical protein